ncbi:hypothetical protein [Streptomyces niveus]|uniref:hypothetical protein n=1 Tax=Streptomyces niveus TaxID=193462 RepID=UPI0036260854
MRRRTTAQAPAQRSRIVLECADGHSILEVSRRLHSERHQISSGVSSLNDEARGSTEAFTFSVGADVPGGAAVVRICLDDGYYEDLTCDLYGRPS